MLQFVVMNILMISVGALIVLVARTLPRIEEYDVAESTTGVFERLVMSEIPEKLDAAWNGLSLKFLRRSRVWVLKLDNAVHNRLSKMTQQKEENGNGSGKLFEDITSLQSEEKETTIV